jgi:hypothetical protein
MLLGKEILHLPLVMKKQFVLFFPRAIFLSSPTRQRQFVARRLPFPG